MRKIIFLTALVFSLVFLFQGFSHAGQLFGAFEPTTKKGHFSMGIGYFFSDDDFSPKNTAFRNARTQQNQIFIQGNYGFIEGGEVYLRGGAADAEIERIFLDNSDFNDDFKPFGTLGVRLSNPLNSIFSVGTFLQGSLYSNYSDETTVPGILVKEKYETKNLPWEIILGAGLQARIHETTLLYAGPMFYLERFDMKRTMTSIIDNITVEESSRYKERNNIGAFLGLRFSLGKQFHVEVEGQMKRRASAGGSITYSF